MTKIEWDTNKMRSCGEELVNLGNELNEAINCLFDRICGMPISTGEWIGKSAMEYSRLAKLDKTQYTTLKDELLNTGQFLISQANLIEGEITSLKR